MTRRAAPAAGGSYANITPSSSAVAVGAVRDRAKTESRA
jgi:hypothetical protein